MQINQNYLNLKDSYLFTNIENRVKNFQQKHPNVKLIRMGIGDVTLPLADAVVHAMRKAVDEMGGASTFHGYSSERGYEFLRDSIKKYYLAKGVHLNLSEIFVSDGAKSDIGNVLDIFGRENTALIPDPVYPVYVDTNIMHGRRIEFLAGNEENEFLPLPDASMPADIIYLCSPNNPTGSVYNKEKLQVWVDYANKNDAIILFDAAYEIFVSDDNLPSSIFQIPGAENCAIEFGSFSKTAGFTGVRCGYTIVPENLKRKINGEFISLNKLWLRRQTTKFNGVSYITQRGADAALSEKGLAQIRENIGYYRQNAKIIADTLSELKIWFTGGRHSPYIWLRTNGMSSWEFFDFLLEKARLIGTPGAGFGECGEGFLRLSAFGDRENVRRGMRQFKEIINTL
ncbi:MAG: LL-diaminopimelate aminotransferase [Clostridiales bacterium]|jgi:LL-diaminopimelate aminotransferase|nr:LL-diaminopimelate aminotransferase [Clostridiales bacterium]